MTTQRHQDVDAEEWKKRSSAPFWTVYLGQHRGGVQALADFDSVITASIFVMMLARLTTRETK